MNNVSKIHKKWKKVNIKDQKMIDGKKYDYVGQCWGGKDVLAKRKKVLKENGFSVRTIKCPYVSSSGKRTTYIYTRKKR